MNNAGVAAVSAGLIGSLIFVLTNFVKSLRGGEWNGVVTQLTAFVVGVAVIFLASAAKVTSDVVVPVVGMRLNDMDFASKLFVGLLATSLFGVVNDFFAARDNSRTSAKPMLVPPPGGNGAA